MMRGLGLTLVIALSVGATPSTTLADGRHGAARGEFNGSRHFGHHSHHGFGHRRIFPGFLTSFVVIPPLLDAPYVAPAPVYAAPPPVYAAPPAYAPPSAYVPAPPSVPRVVEFATGRYELRGDGVYSPYAWVWIPNPPAAPPPPPPPSAPPGPPAAAPDPGPRRAVSQTVALYRWTDDRGVTTWTDSLEKVPARYREHARVLTP
jgi:hypothetical protein